MKQWCGANGQRSVLSEWTLWSTLPAVKVLAATIFFIAAFPAGIFAQTRAECNKCCQEIFSDDYYLERCKLKCFRDATHCSGLRASRPSPGESDQRDQRRPPAERQVVRPETPSGAKPEAAGPQEPQPRRRDRTAPRQVPFVWPDTLVLNPGREWEASGQILAANGISPQHPNYTPALKAIEQVLINFARVNPGGGELPTDQLEQIIRQARR